MNKQNTVGRPIETAGDIDSLPKGKPLKMRVFMDALCNTSPIILEDRTGVPKVSWWTWRNNYRKGKMSLEKQIELAEMVGADCTQIDVIIK